MARKIGFFEPVGIARVKAGGIAIDSATLTDANIWPTWSGTTGGAIDCSGFDTILVGVEIAAGTSPTATIEALFRDAEAADGLRWKRMLIAVSPAVSETTGALDGSAFAELRVLGNPAVFLRVTAVTNSANTTSMNILVSPGQRRLSR